MRVKKFSGDTKKRSHACEEFGRDAVILHTTRKRRWFFGRFGKTRYEVIGAIDPAAVKETAPSRSVPSNPTDVPKTPDSIWPDAIQEVYMKLRKCEIPKDVAQELLKEVLTEIPNHEWKDLSRIWNHLNTAIANQIVTVEPWALDDEQRVAVLIGPTGVGKTTTIAKLAANFALVAGKKVGVITIDTYRIAAVEQLKTYADIIGIPIQVAYSPKELREAIAKMHDRDLILVDTAGRSQNNELQIAELKNYIEGINAEIHLVLSATTKEADIEDVIRVFGVLPIDRIILTKLDETTSHGGFTSLERANVPIKSHHWAGGTRGY